MRDEESLIRLGAIEGKLDSLHQMVKTKLDDHETRLRNAEKSLGWARGSWAILVIMITATIYKLFK